MMKCGDWRRCEMRKDEMMHADGCEGMSIQRCTVKVRESKLLDGAT